jgi:aryl-alcohol dehydrogenase-like predicted oxidoreductase
MEQRQLGAGGPMVGAVGLGCMSFAGFFGATQATDSHRTLAAALEAGISFWDTANVYGPGLSEQVIGDFLRTSGTRPVIATKAGITRSTDRRVDNRPDYLRACLDESLVRLGVDHVDLFYIHRRDPSVPVEEMAGALGDLVTAGKIGGYGLSEVSPTTLRRAHAVHPCRAVQSEYSLWTRQPELGLIQTCADLGVAFVPFSPLARGVLGVVPPDPATMEAQDFRLGIPRFSPANYPANLAAIAPLRAFAAARSWTVPALALAWLLDRGPHIIPIPGTRTPDHLRDWAGADTIRLTDEDRATIARLLPVGFAMGDRYNDDQAQTVERYC